MLTECREEQIRRLLLCLLSSVRMIIQINLWHVLVRKKVRLLLREGRRRNDVYKEDGSARSTDANGISAHLKDKKFFHARAVRVLGKLKFMLFLSLHDVSS